MECIMKNLEDKIDWQDRINQIKPLLKRDSIDFSSSKYADDLLKIMFFVYTYGKGYPCVDDEWYVEEFTSDVLNIDYKNSADPEFCIEVLKLFKRIQVLEYSFKNFTDFFLSNVIDYFNNSGDERNSMAYNDFKSILIDGKLLDVKSIEELNKVLDEEKKL